MTVVAQHLVSPYSECGIFLLKHIPGFENGVNSRYMLHYWDDLGVDIAKALWQ